MRVQPNVGDTIEVCGFALRAGLSIRSSSPDPYGLSGRFVHGHALLMPDGHLEMFGPYGKLDSCIRSNDGMQAWLDFLNTHRLAWVAWCNGLKFRAPSPAPKAIVDEIISRMTFPCE